MLSSQELRLHIGVDGTEQAKAKVGGLGASIDSMAKTIGLATAGFMAMRTAMRTFSESITLAKEQVETQRILASQIETTGHSAGFTAEQFANIATELQSISNYGDEDILKNVTIPLTTFKQISGQVFLDAQKAILDMATAMNMDLRSAAIMVGKALNDPVRGMNAMTRAGVSFTEAERDMITEMVETNRTLDAQKTILSALEGQFGGAAQAGVSSSTQLKNAWGDYLEEMGKKTLPALDGVNMALVNFFSVSASNMAEYNKTMEGAQQQQFRFWNDFMTAFMMNGEGVLLTVYTIVSTAIKVIADGSRIIIEVVKVPINVLIGIIDEIVNTFNRFGKEGFKAFSGFGKRMGQAFANASIPVNMLIRDLTNNLNTGISVLKTYWSDFDNEFSKRTQSAQMHYNDMISLQNRLVKSLTEPLVTEPLVSPPATSGMKLTKDQAEQYYENIIKTQDTAKQAIERNYNEEKKALDTFLQKKLLSHKKYNEALAILDKNRADKLKALDDLQIQQATQLYENIMGISEDETEILIRKFNDQMQALEDYHTQGLLSEEKYQEALQALYARFALESRAIENQKIEEQKQANQAILDSTISILQDMERTEELYPYYYEARKKEIENMADAYRESGVERVLIEKWTADQMDKIWDDYFNENKNKLEDAKTIINNYFIYIKGSMESELGNALYNLILNTDNVLSSWASFWDNMLKVVVRAISEMIAQLMMLKFWQMITGTGGKIFNIGGATSTIVPEIVPPPPNITSVGGVTGYGATAGGNTYGNIMLTSTSSGRNISDLSDRLERLIVAIENNPPQIYTQVIEGIPLHKAVTRARLLANEL